MVEVVVEVVVAVESCRRLRDPFSRARDYF